MLGSRYAPHNFLAYGSKDINANHKGIKFEITAPVEDSESEHDLLIADDHLIDGAKLVVIGGSFGDRLDFQVVDIDNVMGLGANTVLGQYITDWYVNPETSEQMNFESRYPAKIFGGLYMRIRYKAVAGGTTRKVICNYKLHKVLW